LLSCLALEFISNKPRKRKSNDTIIDQDLIPTLVSEMLTWQGHCSGSWRKGLPGPETIRHNKVATGHISSEARLHIHSVAFV
jgi:hypothetical protein